MKVAGKVVEIAGENWYLIVTESKTQVIYSEEKLVEGITYLFLKPEETDKDILKANTQLKAIKCKNTINNTIDDKKKEHLLKKVVKLATKEKAKVQKEEIKTFQKIFSTEAIKPDQAIKKMVGKVRRYSGDIKGQYGTFSIVELKDTSCETVSINLYKKLPAMQEGDVVVLENIKMGKYKKDEETYNRCQTTASSKLYKAEENTVSQFTGVPIGDVQGTGTVLGINNIHIYMSCKKCKKKVNSEENEVMIRLNLPSKT